MNANVSFLQDGHLAAIEGAKEESSSVLRNFYKVKASLLPLTLGNSMKTMFD